MAPKERRSSEQTAATRVSPRSGGARSRNGARNPGGYPTGHLENASIYGFSENLLSLMQNALRELVEVSRARCGLVIDRTGCILASAGDFHPINPSTMGATAAATIAALNSMVSRASTPEVSVKFFGGEVDRIHFVLIEDRLALCLMHSRQATSGQIRSAAKSFLQRVTPELSAERSPSAEDTGRLRNAVQFIETKLDELFSD